MRKYAIECNVAGVVTEVDDSEVRGFDYDGVIGAIGVVERYATVLKKMDVESRGWAEMVA